MTIRRVFTVTIVAIMLVSAISLYPANFTALAASIDSTCTTSSPASGAYHVTLCFTSPSSGSTVSGGVPVTVTASVTGTNPGIRRIIWNMNNAYLLIDYQSPYTFTLPTTKWQDGSYTLSVTALMRDNWTTNTPATVTVSFTNGINQPPVNNNNFTPSRGTNPPQGSPFVVVATGDGASGENNSTNVVNVISSLNPNLFLYLGDVYEKGSVSEFYNYYGTSGTNFGKFLSITNPAIGNHEYTGSSAPGYFDFWNNIPNYYSYNAGGWHFISLNSNSTRIGVGQGSPQYNWLAQDLASNNKCTIVYFHHPLFNIGPEGPTTAMSAIWSLLAQYKVPIVVNGHDHDYQRWVPLDGNGNPSSTGITEFIAGGGGHGLQTIAGSDSRVAFYDSKNPEALGALELRLTSSGANFLYHSVNGSILDSGSIPCNNGGNGGDTLAPSVPTGLAATAINSNQVNLSWQASTDNVGVTGYTIYRNNTTLTTVSGTTLSFSDTTAQPSTTYTYAVDAFDAAGNHSPQSSPVSVTTPAGADTQPPSVPAGLAATAINSNQVNLSWQASTDNVGVTGYTIYRNNTTLTTVSGTTLSFSDTTAQPSTTYTYAVDAFDAAGNHSAQSSPVSVTTPAFTGNLSFTVSADTYVNSGSPTSNYGNATSWRVDGSPDVHAFLRFVVQGTTGHTIQHAYLKVYANNSTSIGINAYTVADNTWGETTVNYNNAPPLGGQLGTSGAFTAGSWVQIEVTSFITGDGTYSFGVTTPGATAMGFASKEGGANGAQLVLVLQ